MSCYLLSFSQISSFTGNNDVFGTCALLCYSYLGSTDIIAFTVYAVIAYVSGSTLTAVGACKLFKVFDSLFLLSLCRRVIGWSSISFYLINKAFKSR